MTRSPRTPVSPSAATSKQAAAVRSGPLPVGRRRRLVFALAAITAAGVAGIAGSLVMPTPASAVIDGEPIGIAQAPWQVSLQSGGGHFCGGTVIGPSTIVTAAHCVEGSSAGDLFVRAGVTDRDDSSGQDRSVSRVIVHPGGFAASADVAVLVLSQPLSLGSNVQAIGLATAVDVAAAASATVSGWGARSEDDAEGSTTLLAAEVPILDDATCAAQLGADGSIVADNELCAEGQGAGSCYGDSGGPLTVVAADGSVRLAGVVSWGVECAVLPGVFAEVPAFAGWITDGAAAGATGDPDPISDVLPDDGNWDDGNWDDGNWDDGNWPGGLGGAAEDGAIAGCLGDDAWFDDAWFDDAWFDDAWFDEGFEG